jgi:hypothetical protein
MLNDSGESGAYKVTHTLVPAESYYLEWNLLITDANYERGVAAGPVQGQKDV